MSDNPTVYDALAYGIPPEQIRNAMRHVATSPNAALSTAVTAVAPDLTLPFPANVIPGMGAAEGLTGTLGYGYEHLRPVLKAIGTNLPPAPEWVGKAGEHFEHNRDQVKTGLEAFAGGLLPKPDMTTEGGVVADLLGGAVGSGIGPLPASLIAGVPRGLKTITSLALAPWEHIPRNAALNVGITGAQTLNEEAFHPGSVFAPDPPVTQTATPPSVAAMAQKVAPAPFTASPSNDPLGLFGTQGGGGTTGNPFGDEPAGPTFAQQGNTDISWGEGLAGLVFTFGAIAAGSALHSRGAAITRAARDARISDPAYAAKVNDYNNEVIKRGTGTGTIGSEQEVAAPVPQGNALRRSVTYLADKIGNDAAKNQETINMMAENPAVAQRLTSQLGNLYDSRLQHNQTLEFLDSGIDRQTRLRMPSVTQLADDVGGLADDRRTVWNMGMRAQNELQNRVNNLSTWMSTSRGARPTVADIRHDFIGKDNSELHGFVTAMDNDPQLRELADRYKMITDGMVKLGNHSVYRFFDNNEARDLLKRRSHIVPEFDVEGILKHPFGPRDTSAYTGQAHGGVDPMVALTAHVEQMYPLFQLEQFKQQLYTHVQAFQARPGAPKIITDITTPRGAHATYYPAGSERIKDFEGQPRDPIVTLRNNGMKHLRVDDPAMYGIFKGNSIGAARIHLDAIDLGRRVYQKGTTGTASLFTGRAMPLRNAGFTALAAPVNSNRIQYGGLADKAWQRATGLRSSTVLRGIVDMPLNVARLPFTGIRNELEKGAKGLSDLLHPSADNIFNRNLRSMIDPSIVDSISQSANSLYERSAVKFARDRGISGQSSPVKTEAPGVVVGSKAGMFARGDRRKMGLRLDTARIAPTAFISGNWAHKGLRIAGIRLHNIIGDAFNDISDLGHMQWLRDNLRNPHMDPETLAYETRNLVGNPSRTGSSPAMQKLVSTLPYTNVSVQGLGRYARSFGERPIASPVTASLGLGTLAALSILTHMRSAAHMDYLQNQQSTQQRESGVALALSPDANAPTIVSLPQELRDHYALMLDFMSKAINTIAARHDPNVFKAVWDGLTHFLGSNITNSSKDAIIHGVVDKFDFINPPSILGRMDWNSFLHGRYLDAYHGSSGTVSNAPPGQGSDAPLDSATGQVFEHLLSNVIGATAHVLDIPNNAYRYTKQNHTVWESIGMAGHDWLHGAGQANPMLNFAFEKQLRLSTNPPIAEALQPTLYALSKVKPAVDRDMEGFVRPGYGQQPVPTREDKSVSSDLLIRQMHNVVQGWKSRIDTAMIPIKGIRDQMHEVEKTGMDPAKRTEWLNLRTRDIADKYKLVEAYVADMDAALSNMAGKPIQLEDIDFSKDSSQFR